MLIPVQSRLLDGADEGGGEFLAVSSHWITPCEITPWITPEVLEYPGHQRTPLYHKRLVLRYLNDFIRNL